ncbi:MAG: hypothetical protein RLZZ28_296 [Bacteroidota bacterium]|jgi:CheY-like chemotaxis protein
MQSSPLKLLLIDDTVMILQQLKSLLSGSANLYATESATSAEEGLEVLNGFQPDIMVLDVNMPGMGGIEMLRKMNELPTQNRPVVIMLTNHTFSGFRDECMMLGADYFLDKSRDFLRIPAIVEEINRQKESAASLTEWES